jgi:predicted alpha/beta-fold hydrolase
VHLGNDYNVRDFIKRMKPIIRMIANSANREIPDLQRLTQGWQYEPYWPFRNRDVMTVSASFLPRRYSINDLPVDNRVVEVAPGQGVLIHCHWQQNPSKCPTVIIVHGMEGSTQSKYALGTADKAFKAGFNAVRFNMRSCGGSEHLSSTLYNASLSKDVDIVAKKLIVRDNLSDLFFAGFSLGGNIILKMAAEYGVKIPIEYKGIFAVSPAIDLHASIAEIMLRRNWIYHQNFIRGLKARVTRKSKLYPDLYDLKPMARIRTIREFDEAYTAPHGGFASADDYYTRASTKERLKGIRIPTIIVHAVDDPFIPYHMFDSKPHEGNPFISFCSTRFGGHVGFISQSGADYDRFWIEHRNLDFMKFVLDR